MSRFDAKIVVITVGLAAAQQFIAVGATVIVTGRGRQRLWKQQRSPLGNRR
jgi:hypothetical protein